MVESWVEDGPGHLVVTSLGEDFHVPPDSFACVQQIDILCISLKEKKRAEYMRFFLESNVVFFPPQNRLMAGSDDR